MNIDIEVVCQIARDAGKAIMAIYGEDDFSIEKKEDSSPLTAADNAAHAVIVAGLQNHWPEIPILSEEGTNISYSVRKH